MNNPNFIFIVGAGEHQMFHYEAAGLYTVTGKRVEGSTMFSEFNDAFRFMQALNQPE